MRRLVFAASLLGACAPTVSAPATIAPVLTPAEGPRSASRPPTAAPTGAPSPPSQEYVPPPLTHMEVEVIGALAALGVTGQRAQHPYEDASIWANFGAGSHFFVSAHPTRTLTKEASWSVLDERDVEGIRVRHARYEGSGTTEHRFECSGNTYMLSGAVPPGSPDMYVFAGRFIRALGCAD